MAYDVVVSGAGLTGLAAAHTFAKRGYKTLVVDREQAPTTRGRFGTDLRTVALSPVSSDQLLNLGAELPSRTGYIDVMHVWESDGSAAITMTADDVQNPHLAIVYENDSITTGLKTHEYEGLELNLNARVIEVSEHARTLSIDGMGTINTRFLVVAEGSNSSTLQLLNTVCDIDQNLQEQAIATLVKIDRPHSNTAWQVFEPTPLALLPLAQPDLLSLIWTLPDGVAAEMMDLSDNELIVRLNQACERMAGNVIEIDRRMTFRLRQRLVADLNPLPWVLIIGDAAHTIHPLAGQGVNLGLEDVRAVDAVLRDRPTRLDEPNLWRAFNAKRKFRAATMVHLMSFFSSVYALQSPYMRLLRNMGVRWLNANEGLKRQLIREAMGMGPIASVL